MKKDKARDIARGVLPSTARKSAREDKRNFHASHRGAQRQANHAIERSLATVSAHGTIAHDPDLYDDFEERDVIDGYAASTKKEGVGWDDLSQNGEIIYSRRGADKLGPLISWATAIEKRDMVGWDVEDKVNYFKGVLPDNLQGRHALGHVKTSLRLETDEFLYGSWYTPAEPLAREDIYNGLTKHLRTTKSRARLQEFLYETVPVAAHAAETANKVPTTVPAVDEDGQPRYVENLGQMVLATATVYVPQIVTTSCDDCTFLRYDPRATSEAVKRFVDFLWENRSTSRFAPRWRPDGYDRGAHTYVHEIIAHVVG